MRCRFTLTLLLLGLLTLPVAAAPRSDILYTTRKEFVQVSPPHPLTLNAHIDKFAYDPLGLEVACAGSETQDGQTAYFVKTLDVRTGKELHRLTMTVPQDADAGLKMMGWTPSGKYLLLERTQPKEEGSGNNVREMVRWDLSADPPVVRPVDPLPYVPEGTRGLPGDGYSYISPNRQWVLFKQSYKMPATEQTSETQAMAYILYDTEKDVFRPIKLPSQTNIDGWVDSSHVRLWKDNADQEMMDINTGQTNSKTAVVRDLTLASKQYPDLTLDVETRPQPDAMGGGQFPSQIVWVRCAPRMQRPLSAVGAGITMGDENTLAAWSPTGKQIAFLNHGDLYTTEVGPVPPDEFLGYEKMAVGLSLTCPEERIMAFTDLKQLGLAITQYTQDNDEKFPPADGVDETIYPYLKDRSLYSVGGVHWAYHAPDNLSLAAMDNPAQTVMGTIDLPCGQIVLYGDGHVKGLPKAAP